MEECFLDVGSHGVAITTECNLGLGLTTAVKDNTKGTRTRVLQSYMMRKITDFVSVPICIWNFLYKSTLLSIGNSAGFQDLENRQITDLVRPLAIGSLVGKGRGRQLVVQGNSALYRPFSSWIEER